MSGQPLVRLMTAATQAAVAHLNAELARKGYSGIRAADGYALLALETDGATTSQLAERIGITKQGAAKVAARLEAQGFIRRKPHERDARAAILTRTPRAERLLRQAEQIQRQMEREWARDIGEMELHAMRQALEAVVGNQPPTPLRRVW
jgi:DNA-binding MarR family transcriptional regulator